MKKWWIIADFHYGHELVKKYCGRPDDYEQLLFSSTSSIPKDDVLVCLGDICWNDSEDFHRRYIEPLQCRKILVRGNHDKKSSHWYLNHGWDFVCDSFRMEMYGKKIVFSHEPVMWDGISELNIHGHLHNTQHKEDARKHAMHPDFCKLVSVEQSNYKPIFLRELV